MRTSSPRHPALILLSLPVLLLLAAQARSPIDAGQQGASPAGPSAPGSSNPALGTCVEQILDQAGGPCLEASSVPMPGLLFPPPHDGGADNVSGGPFSFVGGGRFNQANAYYTTVGGGYGNIAATRYSTVGGGDSNHALGDGATIAGGNYNYASAMGSTVGGGRSNSAHGVHATVSGGFLNGAHGSQSTVGGGNANLASGFRAAVTGGSDNEATGSYTFIGGGLRNTAASPESAVLGGSDNRTSGPGSAVGGGRGNRAEGADSVVPGGAGSVALGPGSLAAGTRATAQHTGSFVWGDRVDADKRSSRDNEFSVYASGGARIFSDEFAATGVKLRPGGGSWSTVSDRRAKEHIEPVDASETLRRLLEVPIATWNYRAQADDIRHMGPMAQDFFAAFGLGGSDVLIDTVDSDGVALAAIQGLAALLRERDGEIDELRRELRELRASVAELRLSLEPR